MSNRYEKQESCSQWVFEANDFKLKTETTFYEFDGLLHDWVKSKTETTYQTPQEKGMLKTVEFLLVFPDDSEPNKQFGKKSKKALSLLYQVRTVIVRPEFKNVIKQIGKSPFFWGFTIQKMINCSYLETTKKGLMVVVE